MINDPYRPQDPYENPYRVTHDGQDTAGVSAAILLGALLLGAIGGFIYFSGGDRPIVASNELRPPITQPNEAARPIQPETTGTAPVPMEPGERPAGARQ